MLRNVLSKESEMAAREGEEYFQRVVRGLNYWLELTEREYLFWGIWKFAK